MDPKQLELRDSLLLSTLLVFFIQSVTTLVESIYMLDLLNLALDEKALGLLFFFSPIIMLFKYIRIHLWEKIGGFCLIGFRLLFPFLSTEWKLLVSGIAVGGGLIFLLAHLAKHQNNLGNFIHFGLSLGLAILLLTVLRSVYSGSDISLGSKYQVISWALIIYPIYSLVTQKAETYVIQDNGKGTTLLPILGFNLTLLLVYLTFGAPSVMVRWVETDYVVFISFYMVIYVASCLLYYLKPQIFLLLKKKAIIVWNLLFGFALLISILINQVEFLQAGSTKSIVVEMNWVPAQLPMYIVVLLSPILMINTSVFTSSLAGRSTSVKGFVGAFLVSSLMFIILIFSYIFTNVWGYVEPVSPYFRGLFWLTFVIINLIVILLLGKLGIESLFAISAHKTVKHSLTIALILLVIIGIVALPSKQGSSTFDGTLTVMTYNIQQGVNADGEKSYQEQLEVIQSSGADIIGLQESDTAKINTGNSDVVRFFADHLGYYSYYGPKTVMQTYGVAILSRFPITDAYSIYVGGNEDEIGSLHAILSIDNRQVHVVVNHPAGSPEVKLQHTKVMLADVKGKQNVILLGDFNWRRSSDYYPMVIADFNDTWKDVYPNLIDDNGLNMTDAIDHIFVSQDFDVDTATYLTSPQSATDHPAYWVDLSFST